MAARLLKRTEGARLGWPVSYTETDHSIRDMCTVADLRSICASVVSQDETRGQSPVKRKAKRKSARK
jgi:hypothetical protein